MPLNVQVARYIDALRKQLGVQGHAGLNLVDDCLPVWSLYDDRPESFILREEARYSIAFSAAALAGNYNRVHVTNPAGSGVIIVLDGFRSRATDHIYGPDSVNGATVLVNSYRLDRRNAQPPRLLVTADQNAADSLLVAMGQAPAGFDVRAGVVLNPGGIFGFRTYAVNQQLDLTLEWREFLPTDEEMRG